jgi:hypothetical protein
MHNFSKFQRVIKRLDFRRDFSDMKTIFIFTLLFITPYLKVHGQEIQSKDTSKSIEQEILQIQETDLSLLSKSRAMLIEALRMNNIVKASKVMQYLETKFDSSRVVTLFPVEKLFVNYWLQNYEDIFLYARKPGPEYNNYENMLLPPRDLLYKELQSITRKSIASLDKEARSQSFPQYKKEFLSLLLKGITLRDDSPEDKESYWKKMNPQSDEYLRTYKGSEFDPFVRNHLRYVIATSDWGYGGDLSAGYLTLPGSINRYITDYGLLTIGLETAYKNAYGCMRLDIGAAHGVRKEFEYNGRWNEGLKIIHTGITFQGGPLLSLGNNFYFTPVIGISFLDFSSAQNDKNIDGKEVSLSATAWALGFNLDIPLGGEKGDTYLRFNLGYRNTISKTEIGKGSYTYCTLGIALFGRLKYREL